MNTRNMHLGNMFLLFLTLILQLTLGMYVYQSVSFMTVSNSTQKFRSLLKFHPKRKVKTFETGKSS